MQTQRDEMRQLAGKTLGFIVFFGIFAPLFGYSLRDAERLYNQGRFSESRSICEHILSGKSSKSARIGALILLSRSCYKLKDFECSASSYRKLFYSLAHSKISLEDYLCFADSLTKIGAYIEADRVYREAFSRFKASRKAPEILYKRGLIKLSMGDLDGATQLLLKALALSGRNKELRMRICFALGDLYFKRNNLLAARDYYLEALSSGANYRAFLLKYADTYQKLAYTQFYFGMYAESAVSYLDLSKILEDPAEKRKSIVRAAESYEKLGRLKAALDLYASVVKEYPDTDEALISMMRMADLGVRHPGIKVPATPEYSAYRRPLDAYLELRKSSIPELSELAYLRASELLAKMGRYDEALDLIKKEQALFPEGKLYRDSVSLFREILYMWIGSLFESSNYLKVVELYSKYRPFIVEGGPHILKKVSYSLYKVGLVGEALSLFSRIRLEERDVVFLSKLYSSLSRYGDVVEVLKPYVKKHSTDCEAVRILADSLYFLGREESVRYYDLALSSCKARSKDPLILKAARCYNKFSKFRKTIRLFKGRSAKSLSSEEVLTLADAYFGQGYYRKALSLYKRSVGNLKGSDRDYAFYRIGLSLARLGLGESFGVPEDPFWKRSLAQMRLLEEWSSKNRSFFKKFLGGKHGEKAGH